MKFILKRDEIKLHLFSNLFMQKKVYRKLGFVNKYT